jgi:hypothetical protein
MVIGATSLVKAMLARILPREQWTVEDAPDNLAALKRKRPRNPS